jgi:hypothetical protein
MEVGLPGMEVPRPGKPGRIKRGVQTGTEHTQREPRSRAQFVLVGKDETHRHPPPPSHPFARRSSSALTDAYAGITGYTDLDSKRSRTPCHEKTADLGCYAELGPLRWAER